MINNRTKVKYPPRQRIMWRGYFAFFVRLRLQSYNIKSITKMKSELFARIISIVSETTELPEEAILSQNKSEECVAARALFVHFCCTRGVPTCAIRDYLGRKRNDCIAHYNSTYNVFHHSSPYFRGLAMEIERKLCEKESGCPE